MVTMICDLFYLLAVILDSLIFKLIALYFAVVLWVALVLLTIAIKKGAFAPFYLLKFCTSLSFGLLLLLQSFLLSSQCLRLLQNG
jgi:hypothetical protein